MSALKRWWGRLTASHAYRSWNRYGQVRGKVLAGGIAYLGFFAIIPALVLGFAVFGFVLRGQPELFDQVVGYVSDTLPGIVKDAANPRGLIDASHPPAPNALTIAGLVSLVTMLLAGIGWVGALREGVRAVFGRPTFQINPVKGKLRDLFVLGTLGVALLVTGALSTVVASAGSWLLEQMGVGADSTIGQVILRVAAVLVVLVADTFLMVVVLRVMSGLRLPRSDLLQGAVVGAVGLGILQQASGLLLASATSKPLLAGFAVVIGLLVLLNLISRVTLLAAAWAATTAGDRGRLGEQVPEQDGSQHRASQDGAAERPAAQRPAPPAPLSPRGQVLPSFGQRSADRTTVAAGAALGIIAAVGVRTARHGLRAAAVAARGR